MEMKTFNNEIVLCRSSVKRARVCIIRKKIKKLKILKTCKKAEDKEKKLKKADRLLQEVLLLKKVKDDDVTKFALQHPDVTEILQKTPSNDQEHVYATLAQFPDVQKKVESIRQNIPDWETSLPKLLQNLGTRTMLIKWKKINNGRPPKPVKRPQPPLPDDDDDDASADGGDGQTEGEEEDQDEEEERSDKSQDDSSSFVQKPSLKRKKPLARKLEEAVANSENSEEDEQVLEKNVKKKPKAKKPMRVSPKVTPEEKVDDPFFVSKKVALPKLLLSEVQENPDKELKFSRDEPEYPRWNREKQLSRSESAMPRWNRGKPQSRAGPGTRERSNPRFAPVRSEPSNPRFAPVRSEPEVKPVVEEKLHPSWAAKKVKLIQPFQGKKIKFDLD